MERTLTFTMEDALLSAESFAILSGAGLIPATEEEPIYVHTTAQVEAIADNTLKVDDLVCWNGGRVTKSTDLPKGYVHKEADVFCMKLDDNGEIANEPCVPSKVQHQTNGTTIITCFAGDKVLEGDIVLVDYYVKRTAKTQMIEITADKFGGNYYLEASTLFRRKADGVDMPAEFVIPNCKVQSNFTFTMASSGDPSTFTFTIDAFPDYTKFDRTHKVLAEIQVIEDKDFANGEEYRDKCEAEPFDFGITAKSTDVSLSFNDDNKIVVTGEKVDPHSYETSDFGSSARGTQIDMQLPTSGDGQYRVVQVNPGLSEYFSEDVNVTGNEKDKTYTKTELDEGYSFLVTDQPGDIKITLYKDKELVKVYHFKNEVSFAV